ncbi:unnamed protein product [Closterium sp. NIES-53]
MEVARTSMIHAAAPHFLWSFAVRYTTNQLNLWPRVSLMETLPTLRWTGEVGDASVFRVRGSRAFFRDTSMDKLSARAIPCVFLGFPLDAPGHPPSSVSQVDPLLGTVPIKVAVGSGAAFGGAASGGAELGCAESEGAGSEGARSGGAERGGAEPGGAKPWGAEPEGVEPGGAESEGAESGGAEPQGTASSGGPAGAARVGPEGARTRGTGASGTGSVGGAGAGGAKVGDPTEPGGAGAGGAGARDSGNDDPGAGGAGAGGALSSGTGARGTVRPRAFFIPLLQLVLGLLSSTGLTPPLLCPPPDLSQPPFQPASHLPTSSPYTEQTGGPTKHREPESRPASPVHTGHRVPRPRPPPVPGTHAVALRPSSVPLRVSLPPPLESSILAVPDPESDLARAVSPTVSRLLATVVTDPSFESTAASTLVAELVEFTAACRLDYTTALVAESKSVRPLSVRGECALHTDVFEDRQKDLECRVAAVPRFASMLLAPKGYPDAPDIPTARSYAKAMTGPYSSQWQAAMDAKMASWKSTSTYVDAVPPSRANIVDGMWILRVKRPPGSLPSFKARYVARGFSQRQGVNYFHTFSPAPKMITLWVLLHVVAQRDYELHSLDFSTAFLQGSLHKEIWLPRPPGFTRSFPAGTQTTLAALGFTPTTDPSLFLRTDTSLPPFYVLVYIVDLVFATADTEAVTRVPSQPPGSLLLRAWGSCLEDGGQLSSQVTQMLLGFDDSATQRSSQGYTFSLGSGSLSWRSTCSSFVLSSSCEAEIYVGAMDAQDLRWLTYLPIDLREQPRLPPIMYIDNKAMIALCQEHRLEHRTKHIDLRYFLARELHQRGQLHLAYVATRANTVYIFTKALPPGDHQRFSTVLGLVPTLPHLLTA